PHTLPAPTPAPPCPPPCTPTSLPLPVANPLPHHDPPARAVGQCAVLDRIGGEFVQAQGEGQRRLRWHPQGRTFNDKAFLFRLERLDRAPDHLAEGRPVPVLGGEQVVCLTKGMQTREERLQTAGPTMPQGLAGDGLHRGKGVLDAVPALAEQKFLGLLCPPAMLFRPQSLKAEPELPGDGDRNVDVAIRENMGRWVIGHELADELT